MLHLRVLVLDVCVTVHTSLVSRAGTAVHARTLCVCALVPDACHGTHCLVSTRGYSGVAMTASGRVYVATIGWLRRDIKTEPGGT